MEYVGEPGNITETRYLTRPAAEAIGWRVVCDCRLGRQPDVTNKWSSELVVRVPSSTLEDEAAGRIYAADEDVIDAGDAHHGMFSRIWAEQHVAPLEGLATIARASTAVASAEAALNKAVGAARANGASWEAIGRAAGMTRQAAHGRWSAMSTGGDLGGLDEAAGRSPAQERRSHLSGGRTHRTSNYLGPVARKRPLCDDAFARLRRVDCHAGFGRPKLPTET